MKHFLTAVFGLIGGLVLALLVAVVHNRVAYYSEYNALLREIHKHADLQIVDAWRHEDLTLEDFGFAMRSPRGTLMINITDGSNIRLPKHRAVGITFGGTGEWHADGNVRIPIVRFIRFDGPEWKRRGLPPVQTLADVVANFDQIAASLTQEPLLDSGWGLGPDYISLDLPRRRGGGSPP